MSRNTTSRTLCCATVLCVVFWKLNEFWNLSACVHQVTDAKTKMKTTEEFFWVLLPLSHGVKA